MQAVGGVRSYELTGHTPVSVRFRIDWKRIGRNQSRGRAISTFSSTPIASGTRMATE